MTPDHDDPDLADAVAAATGDRVAFGRLAARHHDAVMRVARLLTPSAQAAEDVTQETFLAALQHIASFRADGSLRAWLLQIARHSALRLARRRVGQPPPEAQLDVDEHEDLASLGVAAGWGQPPPDPERDLDLQRRRDALRDALLTLGENDRLVIQLRDVEGLTYEEVARILEVPLTTVKPRLHRARLRLMASLRQRFDDGT